MKPQSKELSLHAVRKEVRVMSRIVEPLDRPSRRALLNERTTMQYFLRAVGVKVSTTPGSRSRDYSDAYFKIIQTLGAMEEDYVLNLSEGKSNQQLWNIDFLEDHFADVTKILGRKNMAKGGMSLEQIDMLLGVSPI